jgi:hypothetical protein
MEANSVGIVPVSWLFAKLLQKKKRIYERNGVEE